MVRLVDDLMEVSRITRGKIELRRERLELTEAIRSALETSEPRIRRAGLSLALELPVERLYVDADRVRLTQVISSLLNNAAKYSAGAKEVRLTVRRDEDQAVIEVRDFGVGIPTDMLERVFDMFTQVAANGRGGQSGLGIGLTLVRSLVQLHGGSVSAASEGLGKGSTFTFRMPLVEAPAPEAAKPASNGGNRLSLKILVVDDNQDAAHSLAALLRMSGHEVSAANDGLEALRCVAADPPDVVLLDLGLPMMDGYEIARRMRDMPQMARARIIAMTGYGQATDRATALQAGFDAHIVKPASADKIMRALFGTEDS